MAKYDKAYKQIFSHAKMVEDLLRGFVQEDWIGALDYTTLEKVNGHYVAEDFKDRSDDVVWRIKLKNSKHWLYLYLLIEFQRRNDPWMALRMLVYIGLLYQDLIKSGVVGRKKGQLKKLPPVFPIVIYNGEDDWTAKQELSELMEPIPFFLAKYLPKQKYWLLDAGRTGEEALPQDDNAVAEMVRLKNSQNLETIQPIIRRLRKLLAAPEHDSLRRALTVWIKQVILNKTLLGEEENPDDDIVNDLDEVETMIEQRMNQWVKEMKQQARQEGLLEGRLEGKLEGRLEGEVTVLERQLTRRFGPLSEAVQQKLAEATQQQLESWTDRILDATRIEDVFITH